MSSKKTYTSSRPMSVKSLLTAGLSLITAGLFLFVLFLSRNPLQQTQDLSSSASIGSGSVSITADQSPIPFDTTSESTINLKANTAGKQVDGIQLVFDVITNVQQPPEITLNTARLRVLTQEVSKAGHGYTVKVILATLEPSKAYVTNAPESILLLKFKANQAGSITLNFDRENSISTEHASNPPKDLLTHVSEIAYSISSDGTPQPLKDDFYLDTADIASRYKTYETTGSKNEVDKAKLVESRTYTLKHTAKIQNTIDSAPVPGDPTITLKLQINDAESETRTFKRSALTTSNESLTMEIQTDFKAKANNTFKVTVDSANVLTESNEANNSTSNSYGVTSSANSCNSTCTSNAECPNNYRCYESGSEKRCRLSSNVTSSSCESPDAVGTRTCNQACSDTSECASGYTCWYNQCRNPENVESSSCAALSTQAQSAIIASCNESCSTNRDCANNMRCFNNTCRLATNPSSTSCSAAAVTPRQTTSVVTQPRATAVPVATPIATSTPRPTASASAKPIPTVIPTPTPIATPEPEPESSALESIWNKISSSFNFSSVTSGGLIPVAVIGAGVLLLIIALFIVLRPKSKNRTSYTPTQPVSSAPKMKMSAKPNPAPPSIPGHGVIPAQKSPFESKNTVATTIKNPGEIETTSSPDSKVTTITSNSDSKVTPPASTLKVSDTPGSSASMMQRIKDKGIETPSQQGQGQTPTTPKSTVPSSPNAENKYKWPDEPTQ